MSLLLSRQYKQCIQTNTAVNDIGAKKSARCNRVLIVTELVVSGYQCTSFGHITDQLGSVGSGRLCSYFTYCLSSNRVAVC